MLLHALALLALAGDPVELRTQISPERDAWVGERVRVFVTVLMETRPMASPRFDLPRVDGALLQQSPGSPLLGTERIDGAQYITQRFELLLFPQREGEIEIPPIDVRVDLGAGDVELSTPPLAARAALPAGVEAGTALITTRDLSVDERFEPAFDAEGRLELTVGDALSRTITLRAKDLLGIALPPAPVPSLDGLAVYPEAPSVDDRLQRGALSGTRSDRVTFVCARAGTYTFPALVYSWWNPGPGMLERVTLPARTLVVVPDPDAPVVASVEAPTTQRSRIALGALLALVAIGALVLWRSRSRLRAALRRRREEHGQREPARFAALVHACKSGNTAAGWIALLQWTAVLGGEERWDSIDDAARALEAPELLRESAALQRALLDATPWSGAGLLEESRALRARTAPRRTGDAPLPGLNPPPRTATHRG